MLIALCLSHCVVKTTHSDQGEKNLTTCYLSIYIYLHFGTYILNETLEIYIASILIATLASALFLSFFLKKKTFIQYY